jgi:hypothetical protein
MKIITAATGQMSWIIALLQSRVKRPSGNADTERTKNQSGPSEGIEERSYPKEAQNPKQGGAHNAENAPPLWELASAKPHTSLKTTMAA